MIGWPSCRTCTCIHIDLITDLDQQKWENAMIKLILYLRSLFDSAFIKPSGTERRKTVNWGMYCKKIIFKDLSLSHTEKGLMSGALGIFLLIWHWLNNIICEGCRKSFFVLVWQRQWTFKVCFSSMQLKYVVHYNLYKFSFFFLNLKSWWCGSLTGLLDHSSAKLHYFMGAILWVPQHFVSLICPGSFAYWFNGESRLVVPTQGNIAWKLGEISEPPRSAKHKEGKTTPPLFKWNSSIKRQKS